MKRCPECRRDYYDETLSFYLDDGRSLFTGCERRKLDGDPAVIPRHGLILDTCA
ncbi:MAG TPA: hypothetical protein VJ781_09120 [Pyrinomonadaceae bacterium]|nr:hypothetical protein [Pyrinomonadaceae bacterium]